MPNPELSTISVRQISQFPSVSAVDGGDLLLLQSGGLGGPYQTVAAANLVATALTGYGETMEVGGALNVGFGLTVAGDGYVGGTLQVIGGAAVGGNLGVGGSAQVDGELGVVSSIAVGGDIGVDGTIQSAGNISVGGDLFALQALEVGGALTVVGPTALTGGMAMTGDLHVTGGGSFVGDLMTGGGIATGGAAKFGGGVWTAGSITAEGGVGLLDCLSVGKDATIGGNTSMAGNLAVTGCSELGPTGITGDLGVFGNLCVAGNFTAEGITTLRATQMCVSGDVAICGNLEVAGLVDAGSGYFKDALATAGNAKIEGGLYVGGPSTFSGPVFLNNDLTVNGRVGICGFLHLNGEAVATELWVRGYVCHVGADLMDAISQATAELEAQIVSGVAGVASFNHRTGAVALLASDLTQVNGVLRPADDLGVWYAWHEGHWQQFFPGGGGGDGIADLPIGTTLPHARIHGLWQPTVTQPPQHATNYYAWRNGDWTAFEPGGGGTGGISQQDLDNALADYLPLTGGSLSGALTLPADGTNGQAVRASQLASYLPLTGGTLQGPLNLPADGNGSQAVRYSQMATAISGFVSTAAMTTAIGAATTDMATQTWTGGQISAATAGFATEAWVGQQIAAIPPAPNTLQLSLVIPGKPGDNQIYNVPIAVPLALSVTDGVFDGATAYITTAAAAPTNFSFRKNGSGIGYLTVYQDGSFSYHSNVAASFAAGDVLQVVAPSPQDATLADVGISLLATRT